MARKIVIGVVLGLALVAGGLFVWAQRALSGDTVRIALADQLSRALGQPVTIGDVDATIFPRVAVTLTNVTVGLPVRIEAERLAFATDLRALLSRRIEHANVTLRGGRVQLPLPAFGSSSAEATGTPAASPIQVVSVEDITLEQVEITSGGRALRGDVTIVPGNTAGGGFEIRRMDLSADGERFAVTGHITDPVAPAGTLTVRASSLSFDRLVLFAMDFARGASDADTAAPRSVSAPGAPAATMAAGALDLTVDVQTDRATFGTLTLQGLAGRMRVTPTLLAINPVRFGVFAGTYDGALTLTLERQPTFRLNARLADIDVGATLAFLGSTGMMTGQLSGTMDISGRGLSAAEIHQSARGSASVDVVDGVVRRLGLLRSVVLATSMRADSGSAAATPATTDEPFSTLHAAFVVGDGRARTDDLAFESAHLRVTAAGTIALDGQAIDLDGQVQLSDELSAQAGRDLVRYTQQDGRATLPLSIRGPAGAPRVQIDVVDLTKRAIVNRANEEINEAVREGLGRVLGR